MCELNEKRSLFASEPSRPSGNTHGRRLFASKRRPARHDSLAGAVFKKEFLATLSGDDSGWVLITEALKWWPHEALQVRNHRQNQDFDLFNLYFAVVTKTWEFENKLVVVQWDHNPLNRRSKLFVNQCSLWEVAYKCLFLSCSFKIDYFKGLFPGRSVLVYFLDFIWMFKFRRITHTHTYNNSSQAAFRSRNRKNLKFWIFSGSKVWMEGMMYKVMWPFHIRWKWCVLIKWRKNDINNEQTTTVLSAEVTASDCCTILIHIHIT